MDENHDNFYETVGYTVENWNVRPRPPRSAMTGRYCWLAPLDPAVHAADLYASYAKDESHRNWIYLPYGPFDDFEDYLRWLKAQCLAEDPQFFAIIDSKTAKALGVASYLRITPDVGVVEVGHIHYSPRLQRTPAATEAMYLMMRRVFDELGYRRYEWKCDALNTRSRQAAERLGFVFDGIFRQATLYKGRNRDTAWYSVIDSEWPVLKRAFEIWLDPASFNDQGRQRQSLSTLISQARRDGA